MANIQNLKPIKKGQLSNEELKKRQSNGGKKSAAKRKERKALKELLEIALQQPNEETGEQNQIAITASLIKQAIKGNISAYITIRDTIGEKPTEKSQIDFTPVTIIDDIYK